MKNVIFILLIHFTFCSCSSDRVGFEPISKKKIMESWAWKIFIFTDLGETESAKIDNNDIYKTLKVNPIFVDDILKMSTDDDLFLSNSKAAFKNPIVNVNLTEIKSRE